MLGLVLGQVLLLPLVAHALRRDATSSDTGRQPISTGRAALLGAAAMLLCYPAVATIGNGLAWLQAALSDAPSEALAHDTLQALAAEGWTLWSLLVAVIATTGIPLCEEVLYRGLLQSAIAAALPRAGRWVAIWLASLLFVLMHLPALDASAMAGALGALLALSLLLGLLYERTGRLAAPIAAHALFNLINLLLAASIA
jgi:membrane protease YdiL (CAAX protease family)